MIYKKDISNVSRKNTCVYDMISRKGYTYLVKTNYKRYKNKLKQKKQTNKRIIQVAAVCHSDQRAELLCQSCAQSSKKVQQKKTSSTWFNSLPLFVGRSGCVETVLKA